MYNILDMIAAILNSISKLRAKNLRIPSAFAFDCYGKKARTNYYPRAKEEIFFYLEVGNGNCRLNDSIAMNPVN